MWTYNDGGRCAAGYKGATGDCVTRAIAIATGKPYQEVYDLVNAVSKASEQRRRRKGRSSARTGVYKGAIQAILAQLGWRWVPTMAIGQGGK